MIYNPNDGLASGAGDYQDFHSVSAPKTTNKTEAKNSMNDGRQASIEVDSSFLKFGSISIPESAGLQLLLPCNEIGQRVHDSISAVYNPIDPS
ncbi:MAG: hypothetical protein BZY77_05540 [SAR202 cluster bacterium Io17-Chloro-G5]|nr:MAG: hypothetical protein BZY77_05540 [SAR202 cluster bacterium Io17-Chloro-G5]